MAIWDKNKFEELTGKILKSVDCDINGDEAIFKTNDDETYVLYHSQD